MKDRERGPMRIKISPFLLRTPVLANPVQDDNLIAGQNDSRIGFNHCGYAWSFDGGKSWGDQTPPFWQFTLLDGHTADACSDPSATFDSKGNAYVTGVIFDVAAT